VYIEDDVNERVPSFKKGIIPSAEMIDSPTRSWPGPWGMSRPGWLGERRCIAIFVADL
jgi:hypothetical protein